jgi:hypothetical protein
MKNMGRYPRAKVYCAKGRCVIIFSLFVLTLSVLMVPSGFCIGVGGQGKHITEEELNSWKIVREGKALEVMQVKDLDSPVIVHDPSRKAQNGKALPIAATISDPSGVKSASLYYRTIGQTKYDRVDMEVQDGAVFTTTIPDFIVIGEGVEYYITATDSVGNPPGHSGSENHPHRVTFAQEHRQTVNRMVFLLFIAGAGVMIIAPRFIQRKESTV